MPDNQQSTATRYDIDNLVVHDTDLVFAQEFGTQTTDDIGDLFTTDGAGASDVNVAINARLGMLQADNGLQGVIDEPRGSNFVTPAFDTLPPSPAVGPDLTFAVFYAHLLYRDSDLLSGDPPDSFADFIMSGIGLTGDADTEPFVLASVLAGNGNSIDAHGVEVSQWPNGPAGPEDMEDGENFELDVYWRILMSYNSEKDQTDFQCDCSMKGLTWRKITPASMPGEVRRVGLSVRGSGIVALDWVRMYSYLITGVGEEFFSPPKPETGGRLFLP